MARACAQGGKTAARGAIEGRCRMEGMASFPGAFLDKSLWIQDSLLEPQLPEF